MAQAPSNRREELKAKKRMPDAATIISSQVWYAFGRPPFLFCWCRKTTGDVNMCLWIRTPRAYVTCEQTNAETRSIKKKKQKEHNYIEFKSFPLYSLSHPRYFCSAGMRHLAARHVFHQSNVQEFFFFFFSLLFCCIPCYVARPRSKLFQPCDSRSSHKNASAIVCAAH